MKYIPSPIPIKFEVMYTAMVNKSGRMQYHKIRPGVSKLRIDRIEFIKAYNEYPILAVRPVPIQGQQSAFQLEFYI